jgi:hypothetical protein
MEDDPAIDSYGLYDPWRDPVIEQQANGDGRMHEHLARVAQARVIMESTFSDPDATQEDKDAARERLSEERGELDKYKLERDDLKS